MKKLESVLNGYPGCGKPRGVAILPQIHFGLHSLILHDKFTMKGGEGTLTALKNSISLAFCRHKSTKFDITHDKIRRSNMKKILCIITLSFLLAVGCALYTSGQETGYPRNTGYPQEYGEYGEYGADRDNMDFDYIYNYLAPYGNWIELDPYGYVWTPRNMGYRWRPYSNGHWVSTYDGWTWMSNDEWGSIPFHYGRWGYDNYFGWFWVPGTVWGPAWVSWRWSNQHQYVGWAPLPPGAEFRTGMGFTSLSIRIPNRSWIFLQVQHFLERDIYGYTLPYERNQTIINFTSIHNNIYYRDNRIINEGIGIDQVRRATGRTVPRYTIRDVREPGRVRVTGNDVHIYRPNFRADTTAKTKPKAFMNRNEARRELAPVKVFEPRLQEPVSAQESAVRRRQAQEKALVEKTHSQELKNIENKRARELSKTSDQAEKTKVSQNYRTKMVKLQQQHQVETQQLTKRNQQDIERVKQVAQQQDKQKQDKQDQQKFKKKNKN